MRACRSVLEIALEVLFVIRPDQTIDARRGIAFLSSKNAIVEQIDADVVEERGEPFPLPLPCCLSYAFQRL